MDVGFIGLGIMGSRMARNILRAGHAVAVWNRTASKCDPLVAEGAVRAASPREAAAGRDVLISIVTDGPDVEAVLLGPAGAAEGAGAGAIFIDMSTIAPVAARSIGERLAERGIAFLDAPVSGGDVGAERGTLTIMAGGDAQAFERARPVLSAMGTPTRVGPAGAGQTVKACNQILCGLNLLGVCEAIALARRAGIDAQAMLGVVSGGAAASWSLRNLGPRILDGDFGPGFRIRDIQKDLAIVLDAARRLRLPLAGTALVAQLFRSSEAHGEGEEGTQALYRSIERLAGAAEGR
ncbi:MAG: NAD(P)-dependent oxidoreductase [Planctomycetes bacterium]|nr:NAD(P)-dependent oxidoreductase [Planctomycetota bacterium]